MILDRDGLAVLFAANASELEAAKRGSSADPSLMPVADDFK